MFSFAGRLAGVGREKERHLAVLNDRVLATGNACFFVFIEISRTITWMTIADELKSNASFTLWTLKWF